ncbi:phage tail protein [Sinorhizobium meliloti]|uniref:phage tail protein n=1 Tax=Rhizobium meliloti TaxID=382 RepID=UPI000FDACBF2|nr:phage tail protein [Sinorhizobium meliloti]MDW9781823.1 phage tail protein [Sinorhizobium meliloti]RVM86373.1 phage tail protein [Sinorhizobium meliloti]
MPLFTAIGAAVTAVSAWIGSLGTLGAFALKTAVGVGLSLAAQALAGKPKEQNFALNGELQGGGDLPRSFILGKYATAGSLVWANAWGKSGDTPNSWLTQVIALSDLPVKGLLEVWVDGEKVTYAPSGADDIFGYSVPEYVKRGPNLYIKFYDGTQTVADEALVTRAATSERPWDATRIGRGVAYVVVHSRCIDNMFNGFPSFRFVVDGLKLYDPSKDSSVGGSGTQRYDNPATWGGDGDYLPAVQAYNLLRGLKYNGKWFYGLQNLAAARLPAVDWIAQINKCRQTIVGASGLEPTYRSAGEIQIDAPLSSAIEALLSACQGRVSEVGGVYRMHLGAPDLASIGFNDGDILSTEEQEFTPFVGLADTINGISATYPSPKDNWAVVTAPPLYRSDLEALDGNRRLMADVPLDFVPYPEQVQRLMKSALEEARRFRRHTLVLPPRFWAYAVPGAIFVWNSVRNGYIDKLMRIDGVVDRANLDVMIDITEVDPADYDWDSATDFQPPVDGAVGPIRVGPQTIVDWFASPDVVKDNNGVSRRPAIRLSWDGSDERIIDVIGVEFEVRNATSLEIVYSGRTDQPNVGSLLISQGLVANVTYGVRGRYIPRSERETLWSNWLNVTTPNVLITDVYIEELAQAGQDVVNRFKELQQELDEFFRPRLVELLDAFSLEGAVGQIERQRIVATVGDALAQITEERRVRVSENEATAQFLQFLQSSLGTTNARLITEETTRATADSALSSQITQLTAETGNNAAAIQTEATARANADSALSTQITSLDAEVGDNLARLIQEETARADGDSANATSINGVSADFNGRFAQGLVKFEAVAAPEGVDARFSVLLRAGTSQSFKVSGFFVEIYTEGGVQKSRVAVQADLFAVTSGNSRHYPMVFENGELKLAIANIGTVNAGLLQSLNGKMKIDLNNGTIEIFS